jgi:hypothetical protein
MPDSRKPKAKHKVAKSETLKSIAKKYGFADEKMVWDYPENRELKKERKDPKDIQPGDIVAIPPLNDDERAEYSANLQKYANAAGAEQGAYNRFSDQYQADRELADKLEKLIPIYEASSEAYIKQYEATVKSADGWSKGVDFAAMLIGMVRSLAAIASKAGQAAEKAGKIAAEEYEKLSAEILKDTRKFTTDPVVSEGTKQTAKALSEAKSGPAVEFRNCLGSMLQSLEKWSSPSFYGQAVVVLSEGKSWSEAATYDLEDECKQTMKRMAEEKARTLGMLKDRAAKIRSRSSEMKKAADAALKRRDEFHKKVREL